MADTNKKNNFLDYEGLSLFWNNVKKVIEDNELVTATALTNLDTRVVQLEDKGSNQGTASNQIIAISYADLKALRGNAQLVPGQQYRITDYTCTTTQENTRAVGHAFDIIVTALDEFTLSEEAQAIQNSNDGYFDDLNLSAWKIWYCLDNDTTRFAWADETNGKGVIYHMIDEFDNDIPYDFKNIQFKHPNDTTTYPHYYYTFASGNVEDNTDCSLDISNGCYSNTIKNNLSMGGINEHPMILNQIIFIGKACFCNTFGYDCNSNSFGVFCAYNTFGNGCGGNSLGSNCFANTFGDGCQSNTFGDRCTDNIFGAICFENTLGDGCSDNSLGSNCQHNTFGNKCSGNTIGNICLYIKFASSESDDSTKYDYYQYNHFGNGCQYILFKGVETASASAQVQNYNFAQGLQGTPDAYLTVDSKRNRAFETKVARNSTGELKIYCEADLIQ